MDQWNKHVTSFGLGQFLGVDLPTGRKGFVPNGAYYNRVYRTDRWKSPTVISLAIGQGELVVTPIQLANVAAAMANRGYWYTPHVVRQVGSNPVDPEIFHFKHMTTIDPEHFDVIIQGMADVFESGTARASRLEGLPMAGKTGTAEKVVRGRYSTEKRFNAFLAAFPINAPKYMVLTIIDEPKPEDGNSGATAGLNAAPMVSNIVRRSAPLLLVKPYFGEDLEMMSVRY